MKDIINIKNIIDYLALKRIIIICGHYGAGKTNIAVNFSIKLKGLAGLVYTLVDLDTVNPYFRGADNIQDLRGHGIDFIGPEFANTNVDVPAVSAAVNSVFADTGKRAVIDVGGDNGAAALGVFADKIKRESHEMIYVVNKYRPMTKRAEDAVELAKFIERQSKLKITAVINNSNIGALTTPKNILDSLGYAKETADMLGAPLLGTSSAADIDFFEKEEYNIFKIFKIENYTKKLF